MTIEEAIKHNQEQVQEQAKKGCLSCAEEHQQLAEWLKAYRESIDKTEAFNKFIKGFKEIETRPNYKIHSPHYWECYYEIEALLNECIEEVENNAD